MPAMYRYEHPEEKGLGEHHAEDGHPPLHARSAARHGVDGAPQHAAVPGELTMADLDMKHGTVVELPADDDSDSPHEIAYDHDRDLHLVDWTDERGNQRRTSVTPEVFSKYFKAVTE